MVNVNWSTPADVRGWSLQTGSPGVQDFANSTYRAPLANSPFPSSTPDGRAVKGYMVVEFEPNLPPDEAKVTSVFISKITEISPGEGEFIPFTGWTGEPILAVTGLDSQDYIYEDFLISVDSPSIPFSVGDLLSHNETHIGIENGNAIFPGDGDDTVSAGQGDDTIGDPDGGNGFDLGDDLIYGNQGDDLLVDERGDNVIYGNQGIDIIAGGTGADTIFGGQNGGEPTEDARGNLRMQDGIETIIGGAGDDMIYGNFGSEIIFSADVRNDIILNTGADSDTIFGGQGDDTLSSGPDDDDLWGQRGNDVLVGGDGADRFFLNGGGLDRILDFAPEAGDKIGAFGGFTEIEPRDGSGDAILDWSRGESTGTVVLEGIDPDDFSEDWVFNA